MQSPRFFTLSLIIALGLGSGARAQETVQFSSANGRTQLTGYFFLPAKLSSARPAIVLMHGRAGAYSSAAKGSYTAATLSQRHRAWASYWAANGFAALLVDGFGPRGYPAGFGRNSYHERPEELDETVARPQDAYGALAYLRGRPEVDATRVGLMGWSNGGSATLAALMLKAPGSDYAPLGGLHFQAGLALYPGCALKDKAKAGLKSSVPIRVLAASDDDEVSPKICETLTRRSREIGSDITLTIYPGAVHSFDDPGKERQSHAPNRAATEDAYRQALAFFAEKLKP
ncbi:dienelactone hydrolase family protein [Ferrovibrio sp. MS7]|uniref:dienelactone hydrolase family protein n=1 Tax=Ferrovibrio plantarum TaxID=3119164 RepID=UPI003134BFDE